MTIQVHILHTGEERIPHATEFLVTHTGRSKKVAAMKKKQGQSKVGRRGCILGRFVSLNP